MKTRFSAKSVPARVFLGVLLSGVLLPVCSACRSGSVTRRYSKVATAASGDGAEWRSAAGRHLKLTPAEGSWDEHRELKAGEGKRIAGVLFQLKPLPAGSRVQRAVLRLRRRTATGSPDLSIMNINKGLRVLRFADGEPLFGILRARMTADKREMVRVAFNSDTDAQVSGLALSEYPVECSLRGENYKAGLLAKGKPYHALLEKWNPARKAGYKLAGAWDEIEVTDFARAQFAADKHLLLGIKVAGGNLVWFADGRKRPWAAPQLIVEYSGGAIAKVPAKDSGTTKSRTKPDSKLEPKPRLDPEPVAGRGKIAIDSEPARADIYVNGKYVGTTPSRELSFPAGEIKVRIEKKGYRPWERAVSILKGNVVSVAPELEKK